MPIIGIDCKIYAAVSFFHAEIRENKASTQRKDYVYLPNRLIPA